MKKQIIALALAASATFNSHADIVKYQTSDVQAWSNFNLGDIRFDQAEEASAWFDTSTPGHPVLKRLVIDMADADNLVINDFDRIEPNNDRTYQAKTAGWFFRKLHIAANEVDEKYMRIEVMVDHQQNTTMPISIVSFEINNLHRTDPNPVVDIATVQASDKRLQLKLLERKQRLPDSNEDTYVIQMNWLGHGNKTVALDMPSDDRKLVSMKLVDDGYSEWGKDYRIEVFYEDDSSPVDAGKLSYLLNRFQSGGGFIP